MLRTFPEQPIIRVPASACMHEGFRAWAVSDDFPNYGRISYVDGGVLIDMSPEDIDAHNQIKTEVTRVVAGLCRHFDLGRFYSDGALLTNEEAGLSNEPDGAFASWEALAEGRVKGGKLTRGGRFKELVGTPDWVLEIVSESSIDKDTRLLREAYHRAGIAEYWLVDALGDEVVFQILRHDTARYEPVEPREGWRRSPVFEREFRLDRDRDRLGDWRYTLAMR